MYKNWKNTSPYIWVILFALFYFFLNYGWRTLDVTYVDWLLTPTDDRSQHYIGWEMFAKDSWRWPIGNFSSLSYPNEVSIVYMDSIPLMALVFKIFNSVLPVPFQYFGWFQLCMFCMQGLFAVHLLKKVSDNWLIQTCYGILFIVCPVFLWRVFKHIALSAQWIVLLALHSIVYYEESFSLEADIYASAEFKRRVWNRRKFWMLLGFFCTTIHLYFFPMCGFIFVGYAILDLFSAKNILKQIEYLFIELLSLFIGALIPMYILGGLSDGMKVINESIHWEKSFNLLNLVNPQKWSVFFPTFEKYANGQSEGFAYLGAGIFLLFFILGIYLIKLFICRKKLNLFKNESKKKMYFVKALAFGTVGVVCLIFSLSPVVTLGRHELFRLPVPHVIENIWSIFRCCGRIIWVDVYLILIGMSFVTTYIFNSVCVRGGRTEKLVLMLVLPLSVVLQIADIGPEIYSNGCQSRELLHFESELDPNVWIPLGEDSNIKHIVYVNVGGMYRYPSLGEWCNQYGKTLSRYYYARNFDDAETLQSALMEESDDTVFLFRMEEVNLLWKYQFLNLYQAEDIVIGSHSAISWLESYRLNPQKLSYHLPCKEIGKENNAAEMIDDFLFVHGGGYVCLPEYVAVAGGTSQFTIIGENMMEAKLETKSDSDLVITEQEMQKISGKIALNLNETMKLKFCNSSDHDMVIYELVIDYPK